MDIKSSILFRDGVTGKREVYGRITATYPEDKNPDNLLIADSNRKIVYCFGPETLKDLASLDPLSMLYRLGKLQKYVRQQVERGGKFQLILFEKTDADVIIPASWDGLKEICNINYPELTSTFIKYLEELKNTKYEDIEQQAGFKIL